VRFTPGKPFRVRLRATRSGNAVGRLVVTARVGTAQRRVRTDARGYATLRLVRATSTPVRLRLRAGTASATAWLRPRAAVAP
jgi:hypothetical protein